MYSVSFNPANGAALGYLAWIMETRILHGGAGFPFGLGSLDLLVQLFCFGKGHAS